MAWAALGQYPARRWNYGFDTGLPAEKQAEISNSLYDANIGMHDDYTEAHGIRTRTIECRTMNEADFFGTYGGLFCLGIILSVEFLFAAVLIIYYKQISEGYEDQPLWHYAEGGDDQGRDPAGASTASCLRYFICRW